MAARVTLPEEVTAEAMLADMRVVNFTAATRSVAEANFTLVAGSTAAADSMVDAGNECVRRTIAAGSFALPAVFSMEVLGLLRGGPAGFLEIFDRWERKRRHRCSFLRLRSGVQGRGQQVHSLSHHRRRHNCGSKTSLANPFCPDFGTPSHPVKGRRSRNPARVMFAYLFKMLFSADRHVIIWAAINPTFQLPRSA